MSVADSLFGEQGLLWLGVLDTDADAIPAGFPLLGAAFTMNKSVWIKDKSQLTTPQLTPPVGDTLLQFVSGKLEDSLNPAALSTIPADDYTEMEWALIATPAALTGMTYEFRVTKSGVPLDTYSAQPTCRIGGTIATPAWLPPDMPHPAQYQSFIAT